MQWGALCLRTTDAEARLGPSDHVHGRAARNEAGDAHRSGSQPAHLGALGGGGGHRVVQACGLVVRGKERNSEVRHHFSRAGHTKTAASGPHSRQAVQPLQEPPGPREGQPHCPPRTCARISLQVLSVGVGAEDEGLGHKHALALGGVQQHLRRHLSSRAGLLGCRRTAACGARPILAPCGSGVRVGVACEMGRRQWCCMHARNPMFQHCEV